MKYIIITGLGGSGKSTLTKRISNELNIPYIHMDEFKYGKDWYMKSYDEFKKDILTYINSLQCDTVILEGVYSDVRKQFINEVIQDTKLFIYLKVDKVIRIGRVIDRCIARYIGLDKGCCVETTISRARLLIKTIETNDKLNNEIHDDIEKFSKNGINTKILENIDMDYPIHNIL